MGLLKIKYMHFFFSSPKPDVSEDPSRKRKLEEDEESENSDFSKRWVFALVLMYMETKTPHLVCWYMLYYVH